MRIGHGYDVHAFSQEGDHVILGGVEIAHSCGLEAHSDGDVLLHAVCDACLGAVGLGDIGQHFPDSDASYLGISSRVLLSKVVDLVMQRGFRVSNLDATIIAQSPRIAPHIAAMKAQISDLLAVSVECINVKATTTEGLGFTGRAEGIAVHAVVLVCKE